MLTYNGPSYLPTWSIFFSVYDVVKQELGERSLSASSGGFNSAVSLPFLTERPIGPVLDTDCDRFAVLDLVPAESNWAHILAAMTAGATGTIVTNPLWVIKTRFMAQSLSDVATGKRYRNTWDAIRTIYSQEGGRAFYRGLMPSLLGVSHVAVQFPLYEQLKIWSSACRFAHLQPFITAWALADLPFDYLRHRSRQGRRRAAQLGRHSPLLGDEQDGGVLHDLPARGATTSRGAFSPWLRSARDLS